MTGPAGRGDRSRDRWRRARSRAREPIPRIGVVSVTRVPSGRSVVVRVRVGNTAPTARSVRLVALGLDPDWLPAPAAVGPIEPGQSVEVDLVFAPAPGALSGRYPFSVAGQYADADPQQPGATGGAPSSGTDTGVLFVDEPSRLVVTLQPAQLKAVRKRSARVTVVNGGDRPVQVQLSGEAVPAVQIGFDDASMVLAPNAQAVAQARLRIRRLRLLGRKQRHPFTITARADGAAERAAGAIVARPVLGSGLAGAAALIAVLALWAAVAFVALGKISDHYKQDTAPDLAITQQATAPGSGGAGSDGGGGSGGGGSGDGGGGSGGGGSGGGGAGSGGPAGPGAGGAGGVRFAGSMTGDAAEGVSVELAPTSLVDAQALEGLSGSSAAVSARSSTGKLSQRTLSVRALAPLSEDLSTVTGADGAWAFPPVNAPGYYVLTFSKPGYQTQRFVQQAVEGAKPESMKVGLVAGSGSLSGMIAGPAGPVGNATITITDGTNVLTTSSNSTDAPGTWSINGLSTPSTYLVTASADGLGAESGLVDLAAGGSGSLDLTMQEGVAAISGMITGPTPSGFGGLGGITVTASSGDLTRTTSTVTTQGLAGQYVLPQLPAPGDYTVTISGDGYQTQTSQVSLAAGQPSAELSATLIAGSAVVQGSVAQVLDKDNSQLSTAGVGITLSVDGEVRYKTLTGSDGRYRFDAVAPGAYTVSAQRFGNVTGYATVEAVVGGPAQVAPFVLAYKDETPATSTIVGRVVDARSGGAICDTDKFPDQDCTQYTITLTGNDIPTAAPVAGDPNTDPASYTDTANPASGFNLPNAAAIAAGAGLKPGSYTLTVSADGYQSSVVQVAVALGQQVSVPPIALYPTAGIQGRILPAVGTPASPSCVVAARIDSAGVPQGIACAISGSGADATCAASTSGSWTVACAVTDDQGQYTIKNLSAASWVVHIVTTDPDYVPPQTDPTFTLSLGEIRGYDATINRKGRFAITVLQPDPASGSLTTVGDADVQVKQGATIIATLVTPAADDPDGTQRGVVTFTGLDPGVYTFSGGAPTGGPYTASGDIGLTGVGYNQTIPLTMILTQQAAAFSGRVVIAVDGQSVGVPNAEVTVSGIVGYANSSPVTQSAIVRTDPTGCFAIQPPGISIPPTADCPSVAAGSAAVLSIVTSVASVAVAATATSVAVGAQNYPTNSSILLTATPAGVQIDGLQLQLARTYAADPNVRAGASIQVIQSAPGAPGATISSDGSGALTWHDPALPGGQARPGTYRIQATLAGFDPSAVVTIVVPPIGMTYKGFSAPNASGPLMLTPFADLRIQVLNATGAQVPNADVTLDGGSSSSVRLTPSVGSNTVTFQSLSTLPTYRVTVRVPGYQFTDLASTAVACTSGSTASNSIKVAPQDDVTVCQVFLTAMGQLAGVVGGQLVASDPGTITALAGSTVSATQCPASYTGADPSDCAPAAQAQKFSVLTNAAGQFSITGTTSTPGLQPGYWQVDVVTAGYDSYHRVVNVPASTTPTCVAPGCAPIIVQSAKVQLTVTVKAPGGVAVNNAAVTLTRLGYSTSTTVDKSGAPGTNSYVFAGIDPTSYMLTIYAAGYAPLTVASLTVVLGQDSQTYEVTLGASSNTISGAVFGQAGTAAAAPLSGVGVFLAATEAGTTPITLLDGTAATAQTASDGTFQFSGVPNGTFWVHAPAPSGYRSAVKQVSVSAGGFGNATFVLSGITRTVRVSLSSANGFTLPSPVAVLHSGATCATGDDDQTATLAAGPPSGGALPYSGQWPNIAPGDYSISLQPMAGHLAPSPGCRAVTVSGSESGGDPAAASFTLTERRLAVQVALNASTGGPSAAVLTAAGLTFPATTPFGTPVILFVSGDSYDVTAAPSGNFPDYPSVTRPVPTTTDPSAAPVVITLAQNGSLRVTAQRDGAPVTAADGATLELSGDDGQTWGAPQDVASSPYTFTGLAPSSQYAVRLRVGTFSAVASDIDVSPGSTPSTATVNVNTVGSLTVTVTLPAPPPADGTNVTVRLRTACGGNGGTSLSATTVTPDNIASFANLVPRSYYVVASYTVGSGTAAETYSSDCGEAALVTVAAGPPAATITVAIPGP